MHRVVKKLEDFYTKDGRITAAAEHGKYIPLYCIHHPRKRWYTKNISPLGCREIFYNLMNDAPDGGFECECSWLDLRPIVM